MCVLNVVSVLYFLFLKDLIWFPSLFLNGGAESPTYKQDQGDLCQSPGFYFEFDFILRKF